jgi:ketopantoate reductase
MEITIIGSGAIGGTLAAHMIRAGHDITLCDADEAHIAAIREHGLIIEGPVNEFTVAAHAITPDELPTASTTPSWPSRACTPAPPLSCSATGSPPTAMC